MEKIILAGATGYSGGHILHQLIQLGYPVKVIARNPDRLNPVDKNAVEVIKAEATRPADLINCCDETDTVISAMGITRQKDGYTYMDVDYQANLNLLNEAKKSGVKKFIYISVLNGERLKHLKIGEAKEKFVEEVKRSGLEYCIIRPNGYFSDMAEFYQMAGKGRVFLFGKGTYKMNPIHGEDLADICIQAISGEKREINAGGPETLTHNRIAETAFSVLGRKPAITYIPVWVTRMILFLLRTFTSSQFYGPAEFFLTIMTMDSVAPEYGSHTLRSYFEQLKIDTESRHNG
jgi:uncharacterized protein YbjT (DUF2867 family)